MIHKCDICQYTTTIKSNMNRHMKVKHDNTFERLTCDYCDCTFTSVYNLNRHMVTKHEGDYRAQHVNTTTGMGSTPAVLVSSPTGLGSTPTEMVSNSPEYKCDLCAKVFTRKYGLTCHMAKCSGPINPLQCHLCQRIFTHKSSKSRHVKNCRGNASRLPMSSPQHATTINNIENQHNGDNIENQHNGDNITNNNITVINFAPGSSEQMQFILDRMNNDTLRHAMLTQDEPAVLIAYTKMLMEQPANQCVEKTNMRSGHSRVHIGDGVWETCGDAEVYPKLVADMATSASDYLHSNQSELSVDRRTFKKVQEFHDYAADNGYCADDAKAPEVMRKYKKVVQRTKGVVFDATRKSKNIKSTS
jgi:hypothetical protein